MKINFNEQTYEEFYEFLKQNTNLTEYFNEATLKIFKLQLEVDYPDGVEQDYFVQNCPDGKEFNELYGYLGEK